MSLATTGGIGAGGAGGAGLSAVAMAHGGPSAVSVHQQTTFNGQSGADVPPGTSSSANYSALAHELLDKNQNLNWKQIRSVDHLPIVCVDLFGDQSHVSYYPSKMDDDDHAPSVKVQTIGELSKMGSSLRFKKDNDASYKALRRVLTKSKGYDTLFTHAPSDSDSDNSIVIVAKPHLLLGARNTQYLHDATLKNYTILSTDNTKQHAIDEDNAAKSTSPVSICNTTLDGIDAPKNNDFDRVAIQLRLHSAKKTVTMLPDDAVSLVIAKAKQLVSQSVGIPKEEEESKENYYLRFPTAFAVPAWACRTNLIESLVDSSNLASPSEGGSNNPVLFQRSIAALAGFFVPKEVAAKDGSSQYVYPKICQKIVKLYQEDEKKKELAKILKKEDEIKNKNYMPTVVMVGLTEDGLELTAIQVKPGVSDIQCPFGEYSVVCSVSYNHSNPLSILEEKFVEFTDAVDDILGTGLEIDGGVVGVITYGTIVQQLKAKDCISKALNGINDGVWNKDIEFASTNEAVVSIGLSVLAATAYSRIASPTKNIPIEVSNVATSAVGVSYNFHGGKDDSWSEPKIIFDYDRRVPAGPYKIELSAAECAAIRNDPALFTDPEKLFDEAKKWGGSKYNNVREAAASDLRIKVVQRLERDGKWIPVGDTIHALTLGALDSHQGDDENATVAVESSLIEITMDSMSFVSVSVSGEGHTIEEALKREKFSSFMSYVGIALLFLFFGVPIIKSYVDDHRLQRDSKRLLAYYKHVLPDSISSHDHNQAMWIVYKYRGRTDKLWKKLEDKYGVPVRHAHEWDDYKQPGKDENEDEEENLDENNNHDAEDL